MSNKTLKHETWNKHKKDKEGTLLTLFSIQGISWGRRVVKIHIKLFSSLDNNECWGGTTSRVTLVMTSRAIDMDGQWHGWGRVCCGCWGIDGGWGLNHHIVFVNFGDRKVGSGLVRVTKLDGGSVIGFSSFYGEVKGTKPHACLLVRLFF